jgi:hypothetical protein
VTIGTKKASIEMTGFIGLDRICLAGNKSEENKCMNDFEFFVLTKLSSTAFFDEIIGGMLGLGLDLPDNGPSIVSTLFREGYIDEQVLAVHIDTGN